MGEVSRRLNAGDRHRAPPVTGRQLAALIGRIADGTVSNNAAGRCSMPCGHSAGRAMSTP
jgi:Asp-tRNA(Asn)/Glu-tRNA(Gln) amidotransferase B subunit